MPLKEDEQKIIEIKKGIKFVEEYKGKISKALKRKYIGELNSYWIEFFKSY